MKLTTLILLVLTLAPLSAQNNVSVEVYQDAKFLAVGDKERGYKAGTIDAVFRLTMQGNQDKAGYFTVSPEFEYADIDGIYKRYSANIGYTFNKWINNSEFAITIGYGWIDRYGKSFFSSGGTLAYKYKITDNFKVVALGQLTERKELKALYGSNPFKVSGFIGLEINLR